MGVRCLDGPSSRTAIEQARGDVTTFFTDATLLVFAIDFVHIDLIDMVTRNETAQLLRDAQTHADGGDYVAAMAGLVIAFDDLLDHYAQRRYIDSGDPFSFGPTLREFRAPVHAPFKEINHFVEVSKVTVAMQRALRMIALGVDYRRYVQFEILTPQVNRYMGGSTRYTVTAVQQNLISRTTRPVDASSLNLLYKPPRLTLHSIPGCNICRLTAQNPTSRRSRSSASGPALLKPAKRLMIARF